MVARLTLTESELMDELRASIGVQERKPGFNTVAEIAEQLNCSADVVRRRLRKMGSRVESMRVKERRPDGQVQHVFAYRLKAKR
jgi:hypothetical protein